MVPPDQFATLRMSDYLPAKKVKAVADYELEDDWGFAGVAWVGESFRNTCFFLRPAADPDALRLVVLDTSDFPDEAADQFLAAAGLPIVLDLTWAEVRAALGPPTRKPKFDSTRHECRTAKFAIDGYELYLEVSDEWGIMFLIVLAPFDGRTIRPE
jgi:hypothetical protein